MAKKPTIKFDKAGMRKLEEQVKQNLGPLEAEANAAADRESTPANKAHAYARVMARQGVKVDERRLAREYESLMNE